MRKSSPKTTEKFFQKYSLYYISFQVTIVSLIAAVSFAKGEVSIRAGGCKGNTCIGKLKTRFHGITGDVYLEDDTTICIKGFYFDGQGINPDISVSSKLKNFFKRTYLFE